MMKLLVFSLGLKGLNVIKALVDSFPNIDIDCVIGEDKSVINDYSKELISYCNAKSIHYSFRKDGFEHFKDFDMALAIGWRWMIHNIPDSKLIIFHDALLPKYRGFAPVVNALCNKETTIGVSAIFGAKEYDRGNIILQKKIDVSYPTTIEIEMVRISDLYSEVAILLVSKLITSSVLPNIPQDESLASYSLWRDDKDYRINWENNAIEIEHFINCVGYPYLGASTLINGQLVRIIKAIALEDVRIVNRTPGKVIFMNNICPIVVCGKGLLKIETVNDSNGISILPLASFRSRFE